MKSKLLAILVVLLLGAASLRAQTDPAQVKAILGQPLQSREVVTFQLQQFLLKRVAPLRVPASAAEWTAQEQRIRRHLLNDVIFHGWPHEWVTSAPRFQDLGTIPSGNGYQLHKLRYEIVPGFYSTALLYEPAHLAAKMPAVLEVMGHFPAGGKAMEFEQKLCINQALQGMIVLNLEWIDMGEMRQNENSHWFAADLDLVGANGVGLFYLAMRRGLDYLYDDPHVDHSRVGVSGLSGGGWQTIVLSSLDPRVTASVPVAGFTSLAGRAVRLPGEPGDIEQNATDFLASQDYSTLAAMRAPRPTLMLNNAEDNCCFRAALVKPAIFDAIKPFYRLYSKENLLQFYQNTSISAHNEGLESREQIYRFFTKYFDLPAREQEVAVGADLKSFSELKVGVPEDNLTILGLARKLASEIKREPLPSNPAEETKWAAGERVKLRDVVRYAPATVERAWREFDTYHNQVESISYRIQMSNGLSATGVWMKDVSTPPDAALTIFLNDQGKKAAAKEVYDRLPEIANRMERGEQVLVLNLLFTGDAAPDQPVRFLAEMLAASGERPLGMEAAQLLGISRWARKTWTSKSLRLESDGIRSQMVSLVALSLDPGLFAAAEIHGGMRSLNYLLEKPVHYEDAPELFCLDFYKDFDVDRLELLAAPTKIANGQELHL